MTRGLTCGVSKQSAKDVCVLHLETSNDNGVIVVL